jgi:hypothetical protein
MMGVDVAASPVAAQADAAGSAASAAANAPPKKQVAVCLVWIASFISGSSIGF